MSGISFADLRQVAREEGQFLFAEADGALWHFPKASGRGVLMLCDKSWVLPQRGSFSATRLARAIRQDMWRALSRLRGFWPVVRVHLPLDGRAEVQAGGLVPRPTEQLRDALAALFECKTRARWVEYAARPARNETGGRGCSRKS